MTRKSSNKNISEWRLKYAIRDFKEWRKENKIKNFKVKLYWRTRSHGGSFPHIPPDVYVAVVVAPVDQQFPQILRKDVLKKRNMFLAYFGEGYSMHTGPNSMLGKSFATAEEFIKVISKYKGYSGREKGY